MEARTSGPASSAGAQDPALAALLGEALSGDREALSALITLLDTRYGRRIVWSLRKVRSQARTQTLEDVYQDSLLDLMERLRSGRFLEIPAEERSDLVKVLQQLSDRRLRNRLKPRLSPALARTMDEPSRLLIDPVTLPPDATRKLDEHRALLEGAMGRLEPGERELLEKHLSGVPYRELARETGRSENALAKSLGWIKGKLLRDILPRSPTARLAAGEREPAASQESLSPLEIRKAVDALPPEGRAAVLHVYYEGGSPASLAARLGLGGEAKAQARLRRAYETLGAKLGTTFPDAFGEVRP